MTADETAALRARVAELERANDALRQSAELHGAACDRLARLTASLERIHRLTQEISTLDIDRIIRVAVEKVPRLVAARSVSLYLYRAATDELELHGHNHPVEINPRVELRASPNTVMELAVRSREILLVPDLGEFERRRGAPLHRAFAGRYATPSFISVPLLAGSAVLGVLNLSDKAGDAAFDAEEDLPTVVHLTHVLGVSLQNCLLFRDLDRQARTDGLTQLHNYRSFHEHLDRELQRALRYRRALSLVMADVDRFKQINDRFGHPAGDRVLSGIAEEIRTHIRRGDVGARVGGDEFALLLTETAPAGAQALIERLGTRLAARDYRLPDPEFRVRLSAGIAGFEPGMTAADLVRSADQRLYAAKAALNDPGTRTTPAPAPTGEAT